MQFRGTMISMRVLSVGFVAALVLLLGVSMTASAAYRTQCTYQKFTWECADGSENFNVAPPPPVSGQDGNGYFESVRFSGAGLGGNDYVQLGRGISMRFRTYQQYVSWWDASGTLHVVQSLNGAATIPTGAVMVGIPGNILGNFDLPGWIKGKHVDTGEYVLGSTRWLSSR